jgi:hypothetical protein
LTFLQCFRGKIGLCKKEARIFADYCVPGQIGICLFHDCLPADSRNDPDETKFTPISKFFDIAID